MLLLLFRLRFLRLVWERAGLNVPLIEGTQLRPAVDVLPVWIGLRKSWGKGVATFVIDPWASCVYYLYCLQTKRLRFSIAGLPKFTFSFLCSLCLRTFWRFVSVWACLCLCLDVCYYLYSLNLGCGYEGEVRILKCFTRSLLWLLLLDKWFKLLLTTSGFRLFFVVSFLRLRS